MYDENYTDPDSIAKNKQIAEDRTLDRDRTFDQYSNRVPARYHHLGNHNLAPNIAPGNESEGGVIDLMSENVMDSSGPLLSEEQDRFGETPNLNWNLAKPTGLHWLTSHRGEAPSSDSCRNQEMDGFDHSDTDESPFLVLYLKRPIAKMSDSGSFCEYRLGFGQGLTVDQEEKRKTVLGGLAYTNRNILQATHVASHNQGFPQHGKQFT